MAISSGTVCVAGIASACLGGRRALAAVVSMGKRAAAAALILSALLTPLHAPQGLEGVLKGLGQGIKGAVGIHGAL